MSSGSTARTVSPTLMTAVAIGAVALASGVQAMLFLSRFGVTRRTDGLMASYAIYTLVAVLAQMLRTTAVPLITGDSPRLNRPTFMAATAALSASIVAVVLLGAGPISSLFSSALTPGGREVARSALYVFAPAMGLQILAAGAAVLGAVDGRMVSVARAYIASAAGGLVAFVLLAPFAHEQTLAWAVLAASAFLATGLFARVRSPLPGSLRLGSVPRAVVTMLATTVIPVTFLALYPVTIALVRDARAGEISVFGFAFVLVSYLPGLTSVAVGMNDVVDLSSGGDATGERRAAIMRRSIRSAAAVSLPAAGLVALLGQPALVALLPDRSASGSGFAAFVLLLVPWLLATLMMWAVLPSLFGAQLDRRLRWVVPVVLVVHAVSGIAGRELAGFHGLVVAMAIAPAGFTALALVRLDALRLARRMTIDALHALAVAGLAFGGPLAVFMLVSDQGLAAGLAAAAIGSGLYLVVLVRVHPREARALASSARARVARQTAA